MKRKLTVDYGGIQMAYTMMYAGIGAFVSVFLLANDFTNSEIGIVMSAANLLTVLCQPVLADYADRSKRFSLTDMILIISLCVGLLTGALFLVKGHSVVLFVFYVLAMGVHGFLQPLVNALIFRIEKAGYVMNYGLCRAMGSIGYSIVTALLGGMIERYGIAMIPMATEVSLFMLVLFIFSMARHLKQTTVHESSQTEEKAVEKQAQSLGTFVKSHIPFLVLNVGVMFLFFHQYILGSFMIQIITPIGGTSAQMGTMFAMAAGIEVPAMMLSGALIDRFGARKLVRFSLVGFVLKNVLIFVAKDTFLIYVAQLTQVIGYALFYPAMVRYIGELMDEGDAVKGQALFTMMMTVAGVIANICGGMILDLVGVRMLVMICLVTTILGVVIVFAMSGERKEHAI